MPKYALGLIPDSHDERDFPFVAKISLAKLPSKVDLSALCPPVYNQLSLGSCTAQAIVGAHQVLQTKVKYPKAFMPSRLFLYYNERVMLGTVDEDSGAQLRDGIKSMAKQGICDEKIHPHIIKDFKKKPSVTAYRAALQNTIDSYYRVSNNIDAMKQALATGYPVIFGFTVYRSFMEGDVARTGIMKMPGRLERAVGGHAVLAVGYDDAKKAVFVRNSWSASWGLKGYFWMPYSYIVPNLARDFWVVKVL